MNTPQGLPSYDFLRQPGSSAAGTVFLLKLAARGGGSESLQIRKCALANVALPSGVPSFARSKKLPRVKDLLASSLRDSEQLRELGDKHLARSGTLKPSFTMEYLRTGKRL